jgi:hypothetical protein
MLDRKTANALKWMARGIIFVTAFFSVWANVLHVTKVTVPAIIFAAAPPLVVLAAFEIISRIPMRPDTPWYRRLARPIFAAGLAFGGAWLSYFHQKAAIYRYNSGDESNAAILPLLIDGLMIIASVSVIELNEWIRAIERKMAGVKLAEAKIADKPREKPLTGRERIASAMLEMPWATAKEVAAKAEVKENYAATVMSELRRASRTNGHATAPATVAN